MTDERQKRYAMGLLNPGLMSQPEQSRGLLQQAEDFLYPQGWSGGLLGLGNPAYDYHQAMAKRLDPNSSYNLELSRRNLRPTIQAQMDSMPASPGESFGTGGLMGTTKAILPKAAKITGTALLENMPMAARAVPEKAYSIADKIKARIPDADIRVQDWGTGVGQSSYINIYAKEPAASYAARVKAWEAAKGTKRGPEPRQKVISTSVRVSDHSVGPKRYGEHAGQFRPDSSDEEIASWLDKISVQVPWLNK